MSQPSDQNFSLWRVFWTRPTEQTQHALGGGGLDFPSGLGTPQDSQEELGDVWDALLSLLLTRPALMLFVKWFYPVSHIHQMEAPFLLGWHFDVTKEAPVLPFFTSPSVNYSFPFCISAVNKKDTRRYRCSQPSVKLLHNPIMHCSICKLIHYVWVYSCASVIRPAVENSARGDGGSGGMWSSLI